MLLRSRLRKLGEDVSETLELVPLQWKVIQHVREKLVCRAAKRSPSRQLPRTRLRAGVQGPSCWPMSCSPSTACTCRFIVRATSTT
nr:IS66 family transposase zinc-finger binding domain-containing protein [Bradyrhizobium sp. CCGE-LA001]